ncbi:MAG TPA: hypothetical protein VGP26_08325 [Actinophytocola sp.]|nr:hypothetical protein [Actinophytocola sp.]
MILHRELPAIGESTDRPLEEYLRTLWRLGSAERTLAELPATRFAGLMRAAAEEAAPPFDDSWRTADFTVTESTTGFDVWERVILSQVADLRDHADGVPRDAAVRACGFRWHNTTVAPFLASGLAGALVPEPDALSWAEFTEFLVCGQEYE